MSRRSGPGARARVQGRPERLHPGRRAAVRADRAGVGGDLHGGAVHGARGRRAEGRCGLPPGVRRRRRRDVSLGAAGDQRGRGGRALAAGLDDRRRPRQSSSGRLGLDQPYVRGDIRHPRRDVDGGEHPCDGQAAHPGRRPRGRADDRGHERHRRRQRHGGGRVRILLERDDDPGRIRPGRRGDRGHVHAGCGGRGQAHRGGRRVHRRCRLSREFDLRLHAAGGIVDAAGPAADGHADDQGRHDTGGGRHADGGREFRDGRPGRDDRRRVRLRVVRRGDRGGARHGTAIPPPSGGRGPHDRAARDVHRQRGIHEHHPQPGHHGRGGAAGGRLPSGPDPAHRGWRYRVLPRQRIPVRLRRLLGHRRRERRLPAGRLPQREQLHDGRHGALYGFLAGRGRVHRRGGDPGAVRPRRMGCPRLRVHRSRGRRLRGGRLEDAERAVADRRRRQQGRAVLGVGGRIRPRGGGLHGARCEQHDRCGGRRRDLDGPGRDRDDRPHGGHDHGHGHGAVRGRHRAADHGAGDGDRRRDDGLPDRGRARRWRRRHRHRHLHRRDAARADGQRRDQRRDACAAVRVEHARVYGGRRQRHHHGDADRDGEPPGRVGDRRHPRRDRRRRRRVLRRDHDPLARRGRQRDRGDGDGGGRQHPGLHGDGDAPAADDGDAGRHGVGVVADGDRGGHDRRQLHGGPRQPADGERDGDGRRSLGHGRDPGHDHPDVDGELGDGPGGDGHGRPRCEHGGRDGDADPQRGEHGQRLRRHRDRRRDGDGGGRRHRAGDGGDGRTGQRATGGGLGCGGQCHRLPGAVEVRRPELQRQPPGDCRLGFDHEPHDPRPDERHRIHPAGESGPDRRQRRPVVGRRDGHAGGAGRAGRDPVEDVADGDRGGHDRRQLHGGARHPADGERRGDGGRARGHGRDSGHDHADVHDGELGDGAAGERDGRQRCGHHGGYGDADPQRGEHGQRLRRHRDRRRDGDGGGRRHRAGDGGDGRIGQRATGGGLGCGGQRHRLPGAVEVRRPVLQRQPPGDCRLGFDHEPHDPRPDERHRIHPAGESGPDRRQRRPVVGRRDGHAGGAERRA